MQQMVKYAEKRTKWKQKSSEVRFNLNNRRSKLSKVVLSKSMSRYSRIKFKRDSASSYSKQVSHDTADSHRKSEYRKSISAGRSQSEEEEEILNPSICQHRSCCFAYNMTSDVKNSTQLADCLPSSVYQKLAEVWPLEPLRHPRHLGNQCKLQQLEDEENEMVEEFIRSVQRDLGLLPNASQDLQVNVGSEKSSESSEKDDSEKSKEVLTNPYVKFLKKLHTTDSKEIHSKQLKKQASKITKSIIKNFLEWYQSLGGNDGETFIEDSTLQELFQIGFDLPAAKTIRIKIKELPTVPECLATLMNDKTHSTRHQLKRLIKHDIKMEGRPMKMFAFGSMLPKENPPLRYKPPQNSVQKTWMECSRVPADLVSMKTVWGGLERLRSTIAFANWLKNQPDITPPKYLLDKGILDINYEEWNQMFKGFEPDLGSLEAEPSDSKAIAEKPSFEGSLSGTGSMKYESYDSFI